MKKVINILLVIIIICCVTLIGHKYYNYYKDDKFNKEIQSLVYKIDEVIVDDNDTLENEQQDNIKEDNSSTIENKQELKEINNDYKMWIEIENTNINYPVVQTINNEYYLNHNFKGEDNISGTIFIDYLNNIEQDKNIVIYGHNMKNKTMFNNLTKYKDEQFFKNNNTINIFKDGQVYKYEVFSVYVENAENLNIGITFANAEDFLNYALSEKEKSLYNKEINISEDDNLITLVTCSYEYTDARTVVVAVKSN
ncbi:MAG: class B sortase [Clostridium sp.]|nr:class B sortase [Clostridium sp.]